MLETWQEIWFDQLAKQYSQTEDEEQALVHSSKQTAEDYQKVIRFTRHIQNIKPKWNDAQDRNVENFVQRYKWEFPWPIYFEKVAKEDPMRVHFTDLQDVKELMEEMEAAGGMEVETEEGEGLDSLTVPKEGEKERAKEQEEKKRSTAAAPEGERAQKKGASTPSQEASASSQSSWGSGSWHGGQYRQQSYGTAGYHPSQQQQKGTGSRASHSYGKSLGGGFQGRVTPM